MFNSNRSHHTIPTKHSNPFKLLSIWWAVYIIFVLNAKARAARANYWKTFDMTPNLLNSIEFAMQFSRGHLLMQCARTHTHTHPSIIINNIKWSWMCMEQYAQLQCPHAVAIFISQIDRSLSRRERYVFSRQHSRFRNQCKCGFWRANTKLLISLLYSGRQECLLFVRAHFLFS